MPDFNPYRDFKGREVSATAIMVAFIGSAALNTWGASMMFPNLITSTIFGTVIGCGEVIAALSLRHIVADFENHRYWKGRLGALIMSLAVAGCVISGHKAMSTLYLEADANHKSLETRTKVFQDNADKFSKIYIENDSDVNFAQWQRRQKLADEAKLKELKAAPPPKPIIYVLLSLFELVKIGGLYAIATPSTRGLSWMQRKAYQRQAKIRDKQAKIAFKAKIAQIEETTGPDLKVVA